jgi:hypothetical protein
MRGWQDPRLDVCPGLCGDIQRMVWVWCIYLSVPGGRRKSCQAAFLRGGLVISMRGQLAADREGRVEG